MEEARDDHSLETAKSPKQKGGYSLKDKETKRKSTSPYWWTHVTWKTRIGPKLQKYIGRVVLCVTLWKTTLEPMQFSLNKYRLASQMTAAKVMDVIERLPDCEGQATDAVSAYTQVNWRMLQNYWKFPNRNVQTFGFVYHDTNGRNHGPVWKILLFLLSEICTVIQ